MQPSRRSARSPIYHLKEDCHKPDYRLPAKSDLPSSPDRLFAAVFPGSQFGKSVRDRKCAYTTHRESIECNRGLWWTNFSAATADRYPVDLLISQCKSRDERSCARRFVMQLAPQVRNKQPNGVWEASADLMTDLVFRCQDKDGQTLRDCAARPVSAWSQVDHKQASAMLETGVPAESLPAFARAAFAEKLCDASTVTLAASMSCTEGTGHNQRVTAATSRSLWTEFQRRLTASIDRIQQTATVEWDHSFGDPQANIRLTPTASEIQDILEQVIIDNFSLDLSSRPGAAAASTLFPVADAPATPAASSDHRPAAQPHPPVKVSIRQSTERFGLPPPPLFSKMVRAQSAEAQLKQYGDWLERVHARLHELAGTQTAADLQRAVFGNRVLSSGAKHSVNKILFTGTGALTFGDLVNLGTQFDALLRVLVDSDLDPLRSGPGGGKPTQVGSDAAPSAPSASASSASSSASPGSSAARTLPSAAHKHAAEEAGFEG